MLGSNWGELSKARLTLISSSVVAAFSLAIIVWGLSWSSEYQREADNQAREYAEYTYEKVGNACVGKPPVDKADCISQARHERRAHERDEQDLVAQKQSALWAYVMSAAAVIGMGLSAVGVFLVWTTFRETKRANEITESIAKLERRPWIALALGVSDKATFSGDKFRLRVTVTLKNVGQSPAKGISMRAHGFNALGLRSEVRSEFLDEHLEEVAERIEHGTVLIPNEEMTFTTEIDVARALFSVEGGKAYLAPIALVSIAYGATLDAGLIGQTSKGFLFRQMRGGGYAFRENGAADAFHPHEITVRHANGYARAT